MKLNMPMKKLKPAISSSRETSFSVHRERVAGDAVSPAIRPPPTMLTGLSGSRSCSPTIASADARRPSPAAWPSAWTVSTGHRRPSGSIV